MIYTGSNEILGIKLGDTDISAIYAGDLLIYPTTETGWSVEPSTIEMAASGGTEIITITSLSAWTITSSESWVTFSQNSGDSGRTTVEAIIASHQTSSVRTATITVTDGTNVSTIAVSQAKYISDLPSNTFVFNFNAKDYNTSTRTIPRTSGQTLAQDMVFKKTTYEPYSSVTSAITEYEDHIHFSGGTYAQFSFSNSASSPFNITTAKPNMTFIVKMWRDPDAATITPGTTVTQSDVLVNRGNKPNTFNWLARISPTNAYFHTKTTNAAVPSGVTWSSNPVIIVYRIKNKQVEVINITEGTKNTPFTPSYNGGTNRVTFFGQGYQSNATDVRNCIGGDFYWAYLSREALTDAQVQQVIDYNESK